MNKQEAIEAIKKISDDLLEVRFVSLERVIDIVSQIHEPQKPAVLTKRQADYIESFGTDSIDKDKALYYIARFGWGHGLFDDNERKLEIDEYNLFAGKLSAVQLKSLLITAIINGYEVEKEPLYVVTDGNKLYLKEFDELNAVIIIDDVVGATDYAKRYSDKAEAQKAADELGWFVEEVE